MASASEGKYPICAFALSDNRSAPVTPSQHPHVDQILLTNLSVNLYELATTAAPVPEGSNVVPTVTQWFQVILPMVCAVGIVGNLLNLVVLTRRRLLSSMQRLERCATYGLTALALSDMLCCTVALPAGQPIIYRSTSALVAFYRAYYYAFISLFMMLSNWLTVIIAINRFLVVMYPIHARHFLSCRKTLLSIALVTLISILITLPYFLNSKVEVCVDLQGHRHHQTRKLFEARMREMVEAYNQRVWAVFAVFIPLLLLLIFNIALIKEINSAAIYRRNSCRRSRAKDTSYKVTLTLICIVLMFLFLVVPSEVIKYVNPYKWIKKDLGAVVASVTNLLQTLNFSLNFFLYCVVNPYFRRTITDTFCPSRKNGHLLSQHSDLSNIDETKSLNGANKTLTTSLKVHMDGSFTRANRARSDSRKSNSPSAPLTAL